MKNLRILAVVAVAAVCLISTPQSAEAQAGRTVAAPGTPPIGRLVEISLSPWSYGQMPAAKDDRKVSGTLVAMTDRWVVVQEGTFENWVPMERVVVMRASR